MKKHRITLLPSQRVACYSKNESSTLYTVKVEEKGSKPIVNSYNIQREPNGDWVELYKECDNNTFLEIKEAIEKSETNLANVDKANTFLNK